MMNSSPLTYSTLLILSGLICLSVILIAWQRKNAPGAMALIVMMSGTAIWAFTYAIFWIFPNDPAPFFWLDATYLGVAIAPTAFFIFAVQFNHLDNWLNKRTIWVFLAIPILTVIILWTDNYHNLFFAGKRIAAATDIYDGGPWFWINIVYDYTLILLGYGIIYRGYFRQDDIYRRQSLLIILGSVIAPVANLLGLFKISPLPGLDLTPISFTVLGIFYTFGLLRLSLFDIVPVAKEILINTMEEGMVIIDRYDRLVDLNQTALEDLGLPNQTSIGKTVEEIFISWPELMAAWQNRPEEGGRFQIQMPGGRIQTVNMNRLVESRPHLKGWLISWNDVTALVAVERNMKQVNEQLEKRIEEIENLQADLKEQVIHDPLTGLLNRRFLEEALQWEVARADRKQYEIMVLMIDIDSFKVVNDTFGHPAGDKILKKLADVLIYTSRKDDFVIRMGGEEFLIVLGDISVEVGMERAESIRRAVEESNFQDGARSHHITISIGAAVYPTSSTFMDVVIQHADEALYRAKAAGKNQVAISI